MNDDETTAALKRAQHLARLKAHREEYAGKYVAVVNETLVAVGESRREVESKARSIEPAKIPSVLRVPREEDMVCLLSSSHTRFIKVT